VEIESDLSVIGSSEELNVFLSWREVETYFCRNWNRKIVCFSVVIVVFLFPLIHCEYFWTRTLRRSSPIYQ